MVLKYKERQDFWETSEWGFTETLPFLYFRTFLFSFRKLCLNLLFLTFFC